MPIIIKPFTFTNATDIIDAVKVNANYDALFDLQNANIDNANIKAAAGIVDTKLASPNNAVYRPLLTVSAFLPRDALAGTYMLSPSVGAQPSAANLAPDNPVTPFYLKDAYFAVAGKTTKLRVRGVVATNATAPAANFVFGLHALTSSGGGVDELGLAMAAATAGSTSTVSAPSANAITPFEGSDFNVPADGLYLPGCVSSAQIANNATVLLVATLEMRHV